MVNAMKKLAITADIVYPLHVPFVATGVALFEINYIKEMVTIARKIVENFGHSTKAVEPFLSIICKKLRFSEY